jgi:hypothetical protein
MKQASIVAIMLGVLVLVSAAQAFQLNGVKSEIETASLSAPAVQAQPAQSAPSQDTGKQVASLPDNIKNLPQMVGGC